MRILSIALPLALVAAPAFAQPRVGEMIGPDRARAEAALTAQGYKVVEFEAEHGRLEIKAVKGTPKGAGRIEIAADARTGKVIKVETGDGEDE